MSKKFEVTFDIWKTFVNKACQTMIGIDTDDLPDYNYIRDYENHVAPVACAKRAIRNARNF